MITETITLQVKRVEDIREMQEQSGGNYIRKISLVYLQLIPKTMGFIPRVVTEHTNWQWLIHQVNKKLIYIPIEKTTAETT